MARISRVVASGYPHHITQRGVRSIPMFQTDSERISYLDFMANDEPRTQSTLLRGIRTGRQAGSEQFVEMMERLTGRQLALRKSGRRLKHAS